MAGRYSITGDYQRGAALEAYRAVDGLGREVVIKIVAPRDRESFLKRMAKAAAVVDPHVVRILDYGVEDERCYVVSEYVGATDFETIGALEGRLPGQTVAGGGAQAAAGLAAIHAQGIVHGAVSPATIVWAQDGTVKVTDLGIAWAAGPVDLTEEAPPERAHYVSPEEGMGRPLVPASDLYCLGLVLYRLAAGRVAFDGPDAFAVTALQVGGLVTAPTELVADLSPDLESVLLRSLSKDQDDRYRSATAMARDLERVVAGSPVKPPPISVADPGHGSRLWLLIVAALVLVAACLALAWGLGAFGGSDEGGGATVAPTTGASPGPSTVSPAAVSVPNLAGQTQVSATAAIAAVGLRLDRVVTVYSSTVPAGTVVDQAPLAGTVEPRGSSVTIAVSQGPAPTSSVPSVPNVTGQMQNAAVTQLQSAGYAVVVYFVANTSVPTGQVISQSPSGGVLAQAGSSVSLVVANGPEPTTPTPTPSSSVSFP